MGLGPYDRYISRACRQHGSYSVVQQFKLEIGIRKWLVSRLKKLRRTCVCTSTTLQHALARERGIRVSASGIRKVLQAHGYAWQRRSQKRYYSAPQRKARMDFCKAALRLSAADLQAKLALSMAGVVLTMPPKDTAARYNYCRYCEDMMWRLPSEAVDAKLSGDDPYGKQAALARCVPLWGGCAAGGFSIIAFHQTKKMPVSEWTAALRQGAVKNAIVKLKPSNKIGPWHI